MTDDAPPAGMSSSSGDDEVVAGKNPTGWTATRVVAILFLIPSVPMLLGSVAALALFYIAPVRFGGLIARLPADEFIRTVLFFAPATLFALVVLAFLYAREPGPAEPTPQPLARGEAGRSLARWALGLIVPAFLVTLLVLLFSLVAPGRFAAWIEPLPGDRFLKPLLPIATLALLGAALVALPFGFPRREAPREAARHPGPAGATRSAVGLILVTSASMLGLSLVALGISYVQPERFQRLMSRLEPDTFLRLALLFAPATLTAVVILALLYLISRSTAEPARVSVMTSPPLVSPAARSTLAVSVLVGGLVLSTLVALGLLAVLLVLLVR